MVDPSQAEMNHALWKAAAVFLDGYVGRDVRVVRQSGKPVVGHLTAVETTDDGALLAVHIRANANDNSITWDNIDTLSVLSGNYDGRLKDARRAKHRRRHDREH